MPRQSQLDRESVLDTAMALFWARGYGAVSMDDLVRHAGAARYGVYAAFGDKRGLYLAALARYEQVVVNRLFSGVEARDAGPQQVRGYFDGLLSLARSPQGPWGCLMVGAAVERAPEDPQVAGLFAKYRERLRAGFSRAWRDRPAEPLVALALSIPLQARAGVPVAVLAATVDDLGTP